MFCKDLFLALNFFLPSSMIFLLLYLLSAAPFTLTIWPFGPYCGGGQKALIRLKRWSEYWCLTLNPSNCEDYFSVDPHQANLQPNFLLLNSRLHFNPTPTFFEITFNRTFSFFKHISSLKARFSLVSRPYTLSLLTHGTPLRSPSLFCIKLFFGPFPLVLTQMVSFVKHYKYHQIGTPSLSS